MSFSSDIKEELGRQYSKSRHCQMAELSGMIELDGRIDEQDGTMYFKTDNPVLLEKYAILMRKVFELDISKPISKEETDRIMQTFKWNRLEGATTNGLILQNTCCKRAFIRGAFLAGGSMSDPNKSYHFEIVCHTHEQAKQLQSVMQSFDTDAKIVERKGHHVVYLKEGSQIVDMLNVMEAYVALMNLENVRILKEVRNTINRKVNCETANINKTVNAAVKQVEDIELIRERIGLDNLPENLREMALLRLEYPEATLKELGNYLEPPVGKSGVNHRLRKLSAIAEDLK
ncbi:MAG: DNA-binding protein WhiA [Agathobacter sp.]|nr:DNA-binding protein WhiA [Agathobacter sp.]